jgi:uncharacterized protein (DUF2461 family)
MDARSGMVSDPFLCYHRCKLELIIIVALHTAIALATHDKKKRTPRGSATDESEVIEINEKHFEQLRERREVFITYRNSIDKRTEDQRAAAAKDRARFNE